jgi:iron(III) transport system substrate-binding protein
MKSILTKKTGAIVAMIFTSAMMINDASALTVYTAGPGSLAKKLAAGYEKQTGVKVNIFQATTGKVMARLGYGRRFAASRLAAAVSERQRG